MKYQAQPMIGRRNKSWHIINELGGLVEEFDGTRKQAETRASEIERQRSRCPHGILWPHECKPCADFHWANRCETPPHKAVAPCDTAIGTERCNACGWLVANHGSTASGGTGK